MTGWSADGRTNPRTWRTCDHLYVVGDRCDSCHAKRVTDVALPSKMNGGGTPLGSPLLVRPDLGAIHRPGPQKVQPDDFNGPVGIGTCPKCERSYSTANMARHLRACA